MKEKKTAMDPARRELSKACAGGSGRTLREESQQDGPRSRDGQMKNGCEAVKNDVLREKAADQMMAAGDPAADSCSRCNDPGRTGEDISAPKGRHHLLFLS